MSVAAPQDTSLSEFGFLASICQGFQRAADHSDVSPDWFASTEYRLTWSAIHDIETVGGTLSKDLVLAAIEQQGTRVDSNAVAELFFNPVSGLSIDHHKDKIRSRWIADQELRLRADLQDACRNGSVDDLVGLAENLRRLSTQEATQQPVRFGGVDVTELEAYADIAADWMVDGIFSMDQPTLFGARSKCLKTTQLVDLSVALPTQTDWLGAFRVPKSRRVLFITGEANNRAISKRIRKAIAARDGLEFGDLKGQLRIEAVNFPRLPSLEDCEHIRRVVDRHQPDVIIIDPLYRGLGADIDAHRMAEVGDAIVYFAQCCQPAALIISHHVIKSSAREYGSPPELEDLAGAGIAESCGNWWLVGRNEKYAWDWQHDLCVAFGGRDEQAGGRRILFDEQRWAADVSKLSEFQASRDEEQRRADEDKKRGAHHRQAESARAKVSGILRKAGVPMSKNAIEERRGTTPQAVIRGAVAEMQDDETIVLRPYRDDQDRLKSKGLILATDADKYMNRFEQSEAERGSR